MKVSKEIIQELTEHHQGKPNPRFSKLYGIDKVVKDYLQLPAFFPLAYIALLEHGINTRYDKIFKRLADSENEILFLNNSMRQKLLAHKEAHVLGPIFVLFRRMHNYKRKPAAKGTIAFPTHSTHHVSVSVNWNNYAKSLMALPAKYHPIRICMYWLDIVKGHHKIFEDYGFEVITNGYIENENFIKAFYDNLSNHQYATSNDITSTMYYAVEMGIPFCIYGREENIVHGDEAYNKAINEHEYVKHLRQTFTQDLASLQEEMPITAEQQRVVDFAIDEKAWMDKQEARKIVYRKLVPFLFGKLINGILDKFKRK